MDSKPKSTSLKIVFLQFKCCRDVFRYYLEARYAFIFSARKNISGWKLFFDQWVFLGEAEIIRPDPRANGFGIVHPGEERLRFNGQL